MIILIGLALLVLVGIALMESYDYDIAGFACAFTGGLLLVCALIVIPIYHCDIKSRIAQYESAKTTIAEARKGNVSEIERAALTTKITEVNQWLASTRYWNDSMFDIWIPNEVMKLEPLK